MAAVAEGLGLGLAAAAQRHLRAGQGDRLAVHADHGQIARDQGRAVRKNRHFGAHCIFSLLDGTKNRRCRRQFNTRQIVFVNAANQFG